VKIEAYKDNTIYSCRFCHMCQHACTVANVTQNEADTTRGKLFTLFTVLNGSQAYGPEVASLMTHCTTCDNCKEWCCSHFDPAEAIEASRADLVEAGMVTPDMAQFADRMRTDGNPYGVAREEGRIVLSSLGAESKAAVMYFPGCTVLYRRPGVARAMGRIFNAAGVPFIVPEEADCCGIFLHQLGYRAQAMEIAAKNLQTLTDTGVKEVVFSCPHCLQAFATAYREWDLTVPADVRLVHQTDYVAELLRAGGIKPSGKLAGKIAYHDPCTLGRKMGIYDAPREILSVIAENTAELHWNREKAHCCGAGGGMLFTNPEIVKKAAANRAAEAKNAGADRIATACPLCLESMGGTNEIDVVDLVELLAAITG